MGGVSCPGPGYLRAPSTSVSSEPSQPKSVCLTATAWSEMHVFREVQRGLWPTWSKPLISTEEELIPLNSLVTGRACPSLTRLRHPASPILLPAPRSAFTFFSPLDPCICTTDIAQGCTIRETNQGCGFWDPPFPSPGGEKMQNNLTLSK